jgi:hypothetical protein
MRILLSAAALLAPCVAFAQALPLECDDGASIVLTYLDSDLESELQSELDECNEAPIGDWNRAGFADETDAATVSAVGAVTSDDGLELRLENEIALDIEEDESATMAVLVEAEARFTAPEGEDDIPAEIVVNLARTGELDESELTLAVIGEGVSLSEDLDGEDDGELRFPVELEPEETYTAFLVSASELSDTTAGTQTLTFRVEIPVPEPGAPLLLAVGAATLAGARRGPGRRRLQGAALCFERGAAPEGL